MEFALTDEQVMIADTVRAFFAENATSERTRAAMEGVGIDRDLWAAFAGELGLAGIGIPEGFGGAGLGMVELAVVAEAAGAQVAALPLLGHAMLAQALVRGGAQAQKEQWLPRLAAGEVIATVSWNAAFEVNDGAVSGTIAHLPHGAIAEVLLLHAAGQVWLVDLAGEGVRRTAHVTMDQTRPLATVTLDAAPAEMLENGAAAIDGLQAAGWICLAAEALGGAQASLGRTVEYAKERVQFGRPIGSFQAYKHRLADMMVEIEQARSAVYWAACAVDEEAGEAALALHAAKAFCAETYRMCAGNMVQLHGGIGFTWEHDAHIFFKRARSIATLYGDSQWHREQVAHLVMGDPA